MRASLLQVFRRQKAESPPPPFPLTFFFFFHEREGSGHGNEAKLQMNDVVRCECQLEREDLGGRGGVRLLFSVLQQRI